MKPNSLAGAIFVAVLVVATGSAEAQVRYVATYGKDTNDGSSDWPWRTIQHAADVAPSGATIRVRSGIYGERVTVRRSNLSFQGAMFGEAGQAVVDATAAPFAGRGPYHPAFRVVNAENVTISRFTVSNAANPTDAACPAVPGGRQCPINIGVLVFATDGEDVNHEDDYAPGVPSARHVTISNNYFTGVNRPVQGLARGAIGIMVCGMTASDERAATDVVVEGNQFFDNAMSADWGSNAILFMCNTSKSVARGNLLSNFRPVGPGPAAYVTGTMAIEVAGNDPSLALGVTNHARSIVISDNTVLRTIPGATQGEWGEVYGVYVQGAQRVLVERNYFDGNIQGIGVVTERPAAEADYTRWIWIRDNVVREGAQVALAPSFDLAVGDPTWSSGQHNDCYRPVKDVYVTNNTFYSAAQLYNVERILLHGGIIGDSVFRGNIVQSNYGLLRWATFGVPVEHASGPCVTGSQPAFPNLMATDYNVFRSSQDPGQTVGAYFVYTPSGAARIKWSQFRADSGFDSHSTIADPLLTSPLGRPGFTLSWSSPARDAALVVSPSWLVAGGFFGPYTPVTEYDNLGGPRVWTPVPSATPVDIGADEYQTP